MFWVSYLEQYKYNFFFFIVDIIKKESSTNVESRVIVGETCAISGAGADIIIIDAVVRGAFSDTCCL